MPNSADFFDNDYQAFIQLLNPTSVLDVGPGMGRYSFLTKQITSCNIDAVEIESQYVERYNLKEKYNNIFISDIKTFCNNNPGMNYDVVIFGDILEHMFRSEAFDVLDFVLYRSKYVYCTWPINFLQNDWQGQQSEIHKSNFSINHLLEAGFNTIFYKKRKFGNISLCIAILQGYCNMEELAV